MSDARNILDQMIAAERKVGQAPTELKEANWARLQSRMLAGHDAHLASALDSAETVAKASAAAAKSGVIIKVLAVALVMTTASTGALILREATGEPADVPTTLPSEPAKPPESSLPNIPEPVSDAQPTVPGQELEESAPSTGARPKPASKAKIRWHRGSKSDQLDAEVRLLGEIQTLRAQGRPRAALKALKVHLRRFPKGALAMEREALHALLRCELGLDGAQQKARRFLQAYPNTQQATAVRRACGLKK